MKFFSYLILSIFSFALNAQDLSIDSGATWGVVIGISDYQDEAIPDLQFAHKDAELFANYLTSDEGGQTPKENLVLLTNSMATMAGIAVALDSLLNKCNKGDKVIIYFCGHGDVERRTNTQPGYLLCWDAPSRVYMAGGTLSITLLDNIISMFSQKEVQVLFIADISHSGKLSGSVINGTQITTANLVKQYANEIKILSCQPDEYSLEGEQWGGGHGLFTYFLIKGLLNAADMDNDKKITASEMIYYLNNTVSNEAYPHNQTPMVIGAGPTILSYVLDD